VAAISLYIRELLKPLVTALADTPVFSEYVTGRIVVLDVRTSATVTRKDFAGLSELAVSAGCWWNGACDAMTELGKTELGKTGELN